MGPQYVVASGGTVIFDYLGSGRRMRGYRKRGGRGGGKK